MRRERDEFIVLGLYFAFVDVQVFIHQLMTLHGADAKQKVLDEFVMYLMQGTGHSFKNAGVKRHLNLLQPQNGQSRYVNVGPV